MAHAQARLIGERSRLIAVADQAELECLSTAFQRFVELHGRVVSDPQCCCSLTAELGFGLTPVLRATFWSAGAAAKFDAFWPAYRRVYGPAGDYVRAPMTAPRNERPRPE